MDRDYVGSEENNVSSSLEGLDRFVKAYCVQTDADNDTLLGSNDEFCV